MTPSSRRSTSDLPFSPKRRSLTGCAFFFALIAAAVPAWSGSFQVSPVRATLSASRPIQALTVRNEGAEPAVIHVELVAWTQENGKDVYVASKEIIATPPIFTVAPGGKQIVRVGLRRAPDPGVERAYRIYLQEVPPPPAAGFQGLQVALRLGVPVFVNPAKPVATSLTWSARRVSAGEMSLGLANTGNAHVQLTGLALAMRGGVIADPKIVAYVLPGQGREWLVKASPMPAPGATLQLVAQTDAGEIKAELALE